MQNVWFDDISENSLQSPNAGQNVRCMT